MFYGADMVVLPYRNIYQSGVLFQALRYGVPILASDVGSFSEYVHPELGKLFKSGDVNDLAQKLDEMIKARGLFSSITIQEYAKKYSWPRVVSSICELYQ